MQSKVPLSVAAEAVIAPVFWTRPQFLKRLNISRRSLKTLEKTDPNFPKLRQIIGSRFGYLVTECLCWEQTRPLAAQVVATPEMRAHMSELARARAAQRRKQASNRRCVRAKPNKREPN